MHLSVILMLIMWQIQIYRESLKIRFLDIME